jgi:choline dehydrogenase-like flavoprotein
MSEQSLAIRTAANQAIQEVGTRRGLARFMGLTETQGAYCAHPVGGCRMADSSDLGVVNDAGAVYGYEGLYCIDSSIVPTSLGVNPSLTISALSERAAERLVAHAPDLGLPAAPASLRPGVPPEHVGERVIPAASHRVPVHHH